jgi:hypothetical protein
MKCGMLQRWREWEHDTRRGFTRPKNADTRNSILTSRSHNNLARRHAPAPHSPRDPGLRSKQLTQFTRHACS